MHDKNVKKKWEDYCMQMLVQLNPLLRSRGYELDHKQPHIMGERFLTRPIMGGRKLVLLGRSIKDGTRVVIKASNEPKGIQELEDERWSREVLEEIKFAYQTFFSPRELAFFKTHEVKGFAILVTEFIEQERPFLARTLKEQFRLALAAFKAQEGAHATTYGHQSVMKSIGKMRAVDYYIKAGEYRKIGAYAQDLVGLVIDDEELYPQLDTALNKAIEIIRNNEETLDRYGDFLTHWDFIPQNFRIRDEKLYLLDHLSIRSGNKYEGWARFINFMVLYNPPLADALVEYVHLNRTPEESLALKLMRVYRLMELIRYYASWLSQTDGNLHELTRTRIAFWTEVLQAVLDDKKVGDGIIEAYKKKRDALRGEEEKLRQKELH